MQTFEKKFLRLIKCSHGATAIEYALIAGLIALVIIGALTTIGTSLNAGLAKVIPGLS